MIDNEMDKALFILLNGSAEGSHKYFEATEVIENAYNRQKAEIKQKDIEIDILIRKNENLKDEVAELRAEVESLQKANESFSCLGQLYSEIKSEARKEFAERLKKEALIDGGYEVLQIGTIDNLLAEMEERE